MAEIEHREKGSFGYPFFLAIEDHAPGSNKVNLERNDMNKQIAIMFLLLLALGVTGCSSPNYGNTPEQQRKNAKEAQDELSTDVNRGAK